MKFLVDSLPYYQEYCPFWCYCSDKDCPTMWAKEKVCSEDNPHECEWLREKVETSDTPSIPTYSVIKNDDGITTMTFSKENEKMTPEEFRQRAQDIYNKNRGYAGEEGHVQLDNLMYRCLKSLGYGAGLEILFSMDAIWYA